MKISSGKIRFWYHIQEFQKIVHMGNIDTSMIDYENLHIVWWNLSYNNKNAISIESINQATEDTRKNILRIVK